MAQAATDTWTSASSGLWSTSGNWSSGLPVSSSDVVVTTPGASQNLTVTYDSSVAAANTNVLSLTIDTSLSGSLITLSQTAKTLGVSGDEIVGNSGRGSFLLNGGVNSQGARLYLGNNPGSSGTYTLSSGTLNSLGGEEIGFYGTGVLTQTGGVNNANFIAVGNFQAGGSGTYNLSNGATLNVTNNESVGDSGTGYFNQTGGLHTVNGPLGLLVGYQNGASGTFALSGGTLSVGTNAAGGGEFVAYANNATGAFNQGGGVNNTPSLVIANGSSNVGAYSLSNAATLNVGLLRIGLGGTGSFSMTGSSTVNVGSGGEFGLGINANSSGTFTMAGGTLNSFSQEVVGDSGTGTFNQSGGTNNATASLSLGDGNNSAGTYNLSGNGALFTTFENISFGGAGTFIQSGGLNSVLVSEQIGNGGPGTYTQTGGTHSAGLGLYVGGFGSGIYTLSGGILFSSDEEIGSFGRGVMNQSDGSNSTVSLEVGADTRSVGTYNLSGVNASLVVSGNEYVGTQGGTGTLSQSGGLHTVAGTLAIANYSGTSYAAVSGTVNLTGGVLNAGTVQLNVRGVFNQTGGTLNAATFFQSGGSVTGVLQNNGVFTYQSGVFAGRMINLGTVNPGPSFTLGNGLENDGTLTIPSNQAVFANGAGFDNESTLTLAGGTLGGSTIVNNAFISGYGTIVGTGGFTNTAMLAQSGGGVHLGQHRPESECRRHQPRARLSV